MGFHTHVIGGSAEFSEGDVTAFNDILATNGLRNGDLNENNRMFHIDLSNLAPQAHADILREFRGRGLAIMLNAMGATNPLHGKSKNSDASESEEPDVNVH